MVICILVVLAVYVFNIYLASALYLPNEGLTNHMGPRDQLPAPGKWAGRAQRALDNLKENLFLFFPLAFLCLILDSVNMGLAELGAQIFAFARLIYVPLYIASIPMTRSLAYTVSMIGLIMMAWSIIQG